MKPTACPSRFGPRHCGQSADFVWVEAEIESPAARRAAAPILFICRIPSSENCDIVVGRRDYSRHARPCTLKIRAPHHERGQGSPALDRRSSAAHGRTPVRTSSPSASARRHGPTATSTRSATGWRTGCSSEACRQATASRSCRATRMRSPPCASRWPGSAACSCRSTSCSTRRRSPTSCAAPAPARWRSATSSSTPAAARPRSTRACLRRFGCRAFDDLLSGDAVRAGRGGGERQPGPDRLHERHRIAAQGRHADARRRPLAVRELHRRRRRSTRRT